MRYIFCWMLIIAVVGGQAMAAEKKLPAELEQMVPEAAGLIEEDAESGFGLLEGTVKIFKRSLRDARQYIFSGARAIAAIMLGVILLGVVESLSADTTVCRYTTAVGALWITAVSAGDLSTLIGLGQETIARISELSKMLIPILAAATAAAGGVTAASVRQVGIVMFSDVLLTLIERILIPLLYLYIGTAAAVSVVESGALEHIGILLKKTVTWCLSGLLILFTTYLTVSGAVAGAVDAQAVRLAKNAVSTVVPVVGGILAEAAETILAGAGILRGMIGVFGAMALLSLCLVPFLRLGAQYLLYQAAGFVAQAVGPAKLKKLLSMMGDAFALVLAMTASCSLVFVISLISTLTVVVV